MSEAIQMIQRLKNVIDSQNNQIKQLKTTLEKRGELDYKRAQFVETIEYTTTEHSSGFRKKEKQTQQRPVIQQQHHE